MALFLFKLLSASSLCVMCIIGMTRLKGIVHSSSSCHFKHILKNVAVFVHTMNGHGIQCRSDPNIPQNILFSVQKEKNMQVGIVVRVSK